MEFYNLTSGICAYVDKEQKWAIFECIATHNTQIKMSMNCPYFDQRTPWFPVVNIHSKP